MHHHLQINHYLLKTQEIPLSQGFNVIVGPNNAGKTALAQALKLNFINVQHLSPHTKPQVDVPLIGQSVLNFTVQLTKDDLIRNLGTKTYFFIRYGRNDDPHPTGEYFIRMWNVDDLPLLYIQLKKNNWFISFRTKEAFNSSSCILLKKDESRWLYDRTKNVTDAEIRKFDDQLISQLRSDVYFFTAQRFHIPSSLLANDDGGKLRADASNLPSVLHWTLTHNKPRFERYVALIHEVFPDIYDISVPVNNHNHTAEIKLWSTHSSSERDDLAFSLSDSGTGVSQIMAILYVVMTSTYPQVIIIDEPQSFLHPGAIRKLFDILKQFNHQYIITTHSPIVISAANPDTLLLIRKEDYQSHVEVINQQQKVQMNRVLRSVGANLSDVFGADNVLWVEGETEQECFPLIIQNLTKIELRGTVIQSVVSTGDFITKKKKNVELVFEIYQRLTKNIALIPPAFGFIFDTEELAKDKIEDLKRRSKDDHNIERMLFLPRMMYENYLIHAGAIAYVLTNSEYIDLEFSAEQIQKWIEDDLWIQDDETIWNKDYFGRRKPSKDLDFTIANAFETVHGAKLLSSLFKAVTNDKLIYDKVIHGIALTEWLIANAPEHLQSLVEFLEERVMIWDPKE